MKIRLQLSSIFHLSSCRLYFNLVYDYVAPTDYHQVLPARSSVAFSVSHGLDNSFFFHQSSSPLSSSELPSPFLPLHNLSPPPPSSPACALHPTLWSPHAAAHRGWRPRWWPARPARLSSSSTQPSLLLNTPNPHRPGPAGRSPVCRSYTGIFHINCHKQYLSDILNIFCVFQFAHA